MNRFRRYCTALRRYNRSRGFGIHSPFAFYFVRRVLREGCPYYAYENLNIYHSLAKRLISKHNATRNRLISLRIAKMLFRIACYFQPKDILQIGCCYGVSTMTLLEVSRLSHVTAVFDPGHNCGIFESVTQPRHNRIAIADSLQSAIAQYAIKITNGQQRGFVLIDNIPTESINDVKNLACNIIENGGVVIARNLSRSQPMKFLWKETCSSIIHGMTFSNYSIGIIVGLKHLPRQNYTLWF